MHCWSRMKLDFNTLAVLLFCLISLIASPARCDHWSRWSKWSECSRTCDGGATYQERKCLRIYTVRGKRCEGDRFRYKTCNNKPCSPDVIDFRTQQCATYNNVTYGGKYFTWLPYMDRKNPCTLYCIPKGTRTVVRLAPKVLDGTRCRFNSRDMCISGKCWQVGCNHRLGSSVKMDVCGVCGGNNSCLSNGSKGRYHWVEIGLSPCSASCGVGFQTYQYRCRDRLTGNQIPDTRCARSPKPKGRTKSCFRRQCPPEWKIFAWQDCSVTCGKGVATRAVRCMDTMQDGRQQWQHDNFCSNPKPSMTRPCNTHMCPLWYAGEWSPCSVTCGWGEQVREVVCRHEGKTFCELGTKPVTKRNCTTIFPCTDPGARHQRLYQELRSGSHSPRHRKSHRALVIIHEDQVHKFNMTKPRFVVSSWGSCGASCGKSFRQRYVRCQVQLVYLKDMVDLDDAECSEPKPPVVESCEMKPCYKDYAWVPKGLTPCSRSCLGGTQETRLHCVHKKNNTEAPDNHCVHATRLPIYRTVCNDFPCPQRWRIGDFGECSTTCGGGIMTREVRCIQQVNIVKDKVLNLPDVMCEQPVPQRVRNCHTQPCPADWASGFWSECSVSCGVGKQIRPVVCQRVTARGEPIDVDEYHCPPTGKPKAERPCNVTACPEIKIKKRRLDFFQINKVPKVRLTVGTNASLLPGSTILLRCPVRGMNKRNIEWVRNGRPLRKERRVSKTRRGNLRIRQSLPGYDKGVYTCLAGKHKASVKVAFSNWGDIIQETAHREKFLLGFLNDQSYDTPNTTVMLKDPFDRKKRPLQLVVSDWSPCTSTCGSGVMKRKITCEIITENYFEIFPLKTCKKAGLTIPDSIQKCKGKPCTKWITKPWSECLVDKCVREGFSIQVRSITCVMDSVRYRRDFSRCDQSSKPVTRKECSNPKCTPVWNTSKWSECSGACGESGIQSRILTCLWKANNQTAGRSCSNMKRPLLSRPCYNNCTHECVDVSSYCVEATKLRLCRYSKFKRNCCHSCSEFYKKYST